MHAELVHGEADLASCPQALAHEVLDDLLLAVDGDSPAARQFAEVDAVAATAEAQVYPVVSHPFTPHALADPALIDEIDGGLLEHPRPNAPFDIIAGLTLEHDRLDAGAMQQVRQHQSGGAGSHDPDSSLHRSSSAKTRAARWNAEFAAGKPQ